MRYSYRDKRPFYSPVLFILKRSPDVSVLSRPYDGFSSGSSDVFIYLHYLGNISSVFIINSVPPFLSPSPSQHLTRFNFYVYTNAKEQSGFFPYPVNIKSYRLFSFELSNSFLSMIFCRSFRFVLNNRPSNIFFTTFCVYCYSHSCLKVSRFLQKVLQRKRTSLESLLFGGGGHYWYYYYLVPWILFIVLI